jgi:hypothetical protein
MYEITRDSKTGEIVAVTAQCEWFARCDRTTDYAVKHPVLGWVTCCARCAAQCGMPNDVRRAIKEVIDL